MVVALACPLPLARDTEAETSRDSSVSPDTSTGKHGRSHFSNLPTAKTAR